MPRDYGTTNITNYDATTIPAVSTINGNMFYNRTNEKLYVSDSTAWRGQILEDEGWCHCGYTPRIGGLLYFMLNDNMEMANDFSRGTRVRLTVASVDHYGVVDTCRAGSTTMTPNPLTGCAWDGTTDVITKTAHGLVNGDCICFSTAPAGLSANVPFIILNATANTFQVCGAPGGTVSGFTVGTGTCDLYTGTYVTCYANPDDSFTRAWGVTRFVYSYNTTAPGYPAQMIQASSTAPPVGVPGNMYFNTATGRGCISDGTAWTDLAYATEVEVSGWISAAYSWMVARNNEIMVNDFSAGWGGFPKGTRINATHSGSPFYGVVINSGDGAPGMAANPMTPVTYDTANLFTRTAHGLVAGDIIWIDGGTTPGGAQAFLPYYVIATGLTANAFKISATPGGTELDITTASTCSIRTGTHITLAPNADFGLTRAVTLTGCRYSYSMSPPLYPGYFNYTTTQAINPLTYTIGYSVIPTSRVYQFRVDSNTCTYNMREGGTGTSNNGVTSISIPVQASPVPSNMIWTGFCMGVDNGTSVQWPCGLQVDTNAVVVQCFRDYANIGPWTSTGAKRIVRGQIIYGI